MAWHQINKRRRSRNLQHRCLFDFPEEIVEEILKRLPPKSLFKFMSVSKRLKSLVSGPEFYTRYHSFALSRSQMINNGMMYPVSINSFKPLRTPPLLFHHCFTPMRILASDHGLLLSHIEPTRSAAIRLCVSNPLTKQYIKLPSIHDQLFNPRGTVGLATRRDGRCYTNIVFKVVLIQQKTYVDRTTNTVTVSIFSSDNNREWEQRVLEVNWRTRLFFKEFVTAQDFSHKGILHWFDRGTQTIVTYDPFESPDRFGHIRLPDVGPGIHACMKVTRFGDEDDVIRLCQLERRAVAVWRLMDGDKGEWCLEQRCQIGNLKSFYYELLSDCRHVVASEGTDDPQGYTCVVATTRKHVSVIHLVSGKVENVVVPENVMGINRAFEMLPLVPFSFSPCPWF